MRSDIKVPQVTFILVCGLLGVILFEVLTYDSRLRPIAAIPYLLFGMWVGVKIVR